MSDMFEIAVPLASNALTLFVGSGFSKYVTNDNAPNWLELLVELTSRIDNSKKKLQSRCFKSVNGSVTRCNFDLTACAQILEIEYMRRKQDVREAIADIIKEKINKNTIDSKKVSKLKEFFSQHKHINIITTNYDTLLEHYIITEHGQPIIEGSPIPKSNMSGNIYHIHGCILNPRSIVFTMNDYFKFQHNDTYFSRKLFTLLQESTLAICGYSLNDFNLNCILNEAEKCDHVSLNKSSIFLISSETVDDVYKDYYSYTFGIKVLDNVDIDDFFTGLDKETPEAQKLVQTVDNLRDIIAGKKKYTDKFLKGSGALQRIMLKALVLGIDLGKPPFLKLLKKIILRKVKFTKESGAWDQYIQLAEWLIMVGQSIEVKDTFIEEFYLSSVKYSFDKMSSTLRPGYSWGAFNVWKSNYKKIAIANQHLIRAYCKLKKNISSDVKEVLV
jgi:hypothetical protein